MEHAARSGRCAARRSGRRSSGHTQVRSAAGCRTVSPGPSGSGLTASLWIVALAAHLGYDALVAHGHAEPGLGAATVVLYLASSLGIQRVIVQSRAHRLQAGRAAPVAQLRGFS